MNREKSLTFWKWAVGLLVLCNVALVTTVWLKPTPAARMRPDAPRNFVINRLKFDDAQVAKYDELIARHRDAMTRLSHESAMYREALFNHLKNDTTTGLAEIKNPFVDSVTALIALKQKETESYTYYHFAAVRAICTEQQKPIFDKIITDVTRMMARPPAAGHDHLNMLKPPLPGTEQDHPEADPGGEQGPPPTDN